MNDMHVLSSVAQPKYSETTYSVDATSKGLSAHLLKQYVRLENIAAEVVAYQNLNRDIVPHKDLWNLDLPTPVLQLWLPEVCRPCQHLLIAPAFQASQNS